jgi:hypothetical protein
MTIVTGRILTPPRPGYSKIYELHKDDAIIKGTGDCNLGK